MKFTCFQQSSADVDYLLSEQYEDEDTEVFEKSRESSLPQRRFLDRMPRAILAWTVMSTCYAILVTVILAVQMVKSKYEGPGIIYTPARQVMGYHLTEPIAAYPEEYRRDPLFGDPSPGLDQRWIYRLRHATIRLSPKEFSRYNQSGILLGDGSGYLATPTAYHDLHCLRALHKSVYPDYYFPNESEDKKLDRDAHARHCLHNLGHSVTCNADMTIRVMKWHPHVLLPSPVDHEHECMDWNRIDDWAKERYVDTAVKGLLVHPTKGEVFPDGKSTEQLP